MQYKSIIIFIILEILGTFVVESRSYHYQPWQGIGATCTNGNARFCRALYGAHSGFRVECSDTPEFGIYLPRMGGNLRLTLPEGDCIATYIPGRMVYSKGGVQLTVDLLRSEDAAFWTLSNTTSSSVTIPISFGGVADKRFHREGDLGVDDPDCFDLKPEYCDGNVFSVSGDTVRIDYGQKERKVLSLIIPLDSHSITSLPSLEGTVTLLPGEEKCIVLFPEASKHLISMSTESLRQQAEDEWQTMLSGFTISTPDPYINPIAGALAVAADGIWSSETWLHGAIGWRTQHLGWRGAYVGDALGQHTRASSHFATYANNQVSDIPVIYPHPCPDSALNLARAVKLWGTPMYSNGYICRRPGHTNEMSHYDMNLVYIDALLRHFRHTGDTAEMRRLFPVIKRHLDWESLNYDPDGDGLYDAYCCIWASDALYYSGGDVTHSSAYNYLAYRLAGEVAEAIGEDVTPYFSKAERIRNAIADNLWLADDGHWAEFRDRMGLQRIHSSAALWTIYHAIDSEVADEFQAYSATAYIDRNMPHIPIEIEGELSDLCLLSTTDWHPYSWSINNVAIAEIMHTALAYWQVGRRNEAFSLMKAVALDNMYLGSSPLNFGQLSYYDAARGECYRDFADPIGVWSRALVEGLYGINPRLIGADSHVAIRPGFPSDWHHASIHLPDIDYSYLAEELCDIYKVTSHYGDDVPIRWYVSLRGVPSSIKVNGKGAHYAVDTTAIGNPRIIVETTSVSSELVITYGNKLEGKFTGKVHVEGPVHFKEMEQDNLRWWQPTMAYIPSSLEMIDEGFDDIQPDRFTLINLKEDYNANVTDIFHNQYLSPRPDFTTLQIPTQGIGDWCHPDAMAEIDDSGLRQCLHDCGDILSLPNGLKFAMPSLGPNTIFTSLWDNYPDSVSVDLSGKASHAYLVLAGSTNHMESNMVNGIIKFIYTDGSCDTLKLINPITWAPIEQDFYVDEYAFAMPNHRQPPMRLHLASTHLSRTIGEDLGLSGVDDRRIPGGAAIVLDAKLNPVKELQSMELLTQSCNVVIGLMALTLQVPLTPTDWYAIRQENRPFLRWWWLGSAVNHEGLTYNLEEFARKGIGGVEITPIYGVQGNESNDIPYLSKKWMQEFAHCVDEGHRLGIQIDMNNGTGWPFGGPDVSPQYSARKCIVEKWSVDSGHELMVKVRPQDSRQRPVAILQSLIAANDEKRIDIKEYLSSDSVLTWTPPDSASWDIYAIFSGRTFQKVKRAAPGGEGLVLNHYDSIAVKHYLSRFDKVFDTTRYPLPHTFFNDSYEVYGADWDDDILEEFFDDHGYRLEPYIPEFIDKQNRSDFRGRLLRDYRYTLARMLRENFTKVWTQWAHEKQVKIRNQAHGSPANILDLYAEVDIPECESFGESGINIPGLSRFGPSRLSDAAPAVLKFASSAAHLTGVPFTSAESLTWLTEHFCTSLARCKPELDQILCSGVNHTYIHGAPYSPKGEKFPGWMFYASINMSPTGGMWHDADAMFSYITRCQSFLSAGLPNNDFLLYFPIEDIWHEQCEAPYLMFEIHKMQQRAPIVYDAVEQIINAGYDCDYVSDDLLNRISLDTKGNIIAGNGDINYKALIVPGSKWMDPVVLSRLLSIARDGGTLIFVDKLPSNVPGLSDIDSRKVRLDSLLESFPKMSFEAKEYDYGSGKLIMAPTIEQALAIRDFNPEALRRDFGVSMVRRKNEIGGHNYFISMLCDKEIDSYIPLGTKAKSIMIFDPLTGEQGLAMTNNNDIDDECTVRLQLKAGQSLLLKTFPEPIEFKPWRYIGELKDSVKIDRNWHISFSESQPPIQEEFYIDTIKDWCDITVPEAKINHGTASYTTVFDVSDFTGNDDWILDLGDVRESAEVWINGNRVGKLWSVPFTVRVSDYIHPGTNTIRIDVTNLPANLISDYERRGVSWRKFKDANIASVTGAKTFSFIWDPVPSGILTSPILRRYSSETSHQNK